MVLVLKKQRASYPGNPAAFPGLCWLRGADGGLDTARGNSDKAGGTWRGLPGNEASPAATEAGTVPGLGEGGCREHCGVQ